MLPGARLGPLGLVGGSVGQVLPVSAGSWGLVVVEFVAGLLVAAVVVVVAVVVLPAEGESGGCRRDWPNSPEVLTSRGPVDFDWAGLAGLKNLNWPFPYCDDVAGELVAAAGAAGDGAGEIPPDPASCPDASCAARTGANYYREVLVWL